MDQALKVQNCVKSAQVGPQMDQKFGFNTNMNPISESGQVPKLVNHVNSSWVGWIHQLVMCTPPLKPVPPEAPLLHEAAEITATVLVHE